MRTVLVGERPVEVEEWLQRRRALGVDQFDEVWEGEYHVAPAAHGRHGDLDQQLAELLGPAARAANLRCLGPVNIGVADDYRVPDRSVVSADEPLGVYLPSAVVVAEIVSPDDETLTKFPFYFERGVQELLIIDPAQRSAAWFRRGATEFVESTSSGVLLGLDSVALRLRWPD